VEVEGLFVISRQSVRGSYSDGTPYELQRPTYGLLEMSQGDPGTIRVSPRVAPQMIGMGLLEAIPEADIRAAADPDDVDGDGVSGRANTVWSAGIGEAALGRFGWKANVASMTDQVAGAFAGDLGITTSLHPNVKCTDGSVSCLAAPSGGAPELDDDRLGHVVFYSRTLSVPAQRDVKVREVREGAEAFIDTGCVACHTPVHTTGPSQIAALANQTIRPYTDLLLHDMGEGLADGRPDFLASGTEWRTPPLWGIGLFGAINGHTRYLHDGRARNLEEAILWHGGEAQAARDAFAALDANTRAAMLRFLGTL
jgi:CxxC motif-containing protein (DUF1111 family)